MTYSMLIVLTEYVATEDEVRSIFRSHHLRVWKTRELAGRFHLSSINGLLSASSSGSEFQNATDDPPMPGWIVAFSSIHDVKKALATCNLRFIPHSTPPNQVFVFEHGNYESPHPIHSIHVGYTARTIYHLPDKYQTDAALYDLLQPFGCVIHLVYILRGVGVVHFGSKDDAEIAEAAARRFYPALDLKFRLLSCTMISFWYIWAEELQQSYVSPSHPRDLPQVLESHHGSFLYKDSLVVGVKLFLCKKRERRRVSISSASPSEDDVKPAKSGVFTLPSDPLLVFYPLSWIYAFILLVWSGSFNIVRKGTMPATQIQGSVQANSGQTTPESGHDPRIQDVINRISKSITRLNKTFLDSALGNAGSILTDLIDQNRDDLQELNERTNSCMADLEKRLLERMEQIQKLEGIISVLNKEVHQATTTARAFRQAKETNDQERNEEVNNLKKSIELLETDIKQLQDSLAESQAHCTSIDEDSLQRRVKCRTAEGKVARLTYRTENGEVTVPE